MKYSCSCILSFYSLSLISSAIPIPLCLVHLFHHFICFSETVKQLTSTIIHTDRHSMAFLITLSCLDQRLNMFFPRPCVHLLLAYLGLNSVEPSEPENLSTSKFSLCMIDLLNIFIEFLFRNFLLLSEPPCLL